MPTGRNFFRSLFVLSVWILSLVCIRADEGPLGVPVRINATASIYVNNSHDPAQLTLSMPIAPSTIHPDGVYQLVDQADSGIVGVLDAHPFNPQGADPRFVAQLLPNKLYGLSVVAARLTEVDIVVTPPAGYDVEIEGVVRSTFVLKPLGADMMQSVAIRVFRPQDRFTGRAGTATSITSGRVEWQVALGSAKGGATAGALSIIDAGTDALWDSLFTPAGLQYQKTSPEISVNSPGGVIRQIIANEAAVDLVTLSSTSYELRFFHFDQLDGTAGTLRTFKGFPFVTYRIEQGSTATTLKITSETRTLDGDFSTGVPATGSVIGVADTHAPIARTAATTLTRSIVNSAFVWDLDDWNTTGPGHTQLVHEKRTWGGTSSARTEDLDIGSGVTRALQTYHTYDWGEELVGAAMGSVLTTTPTTAIDYYASSGPVGSYGAVRSRSTPGNGANGDVWEAYEYDLSNFGVVTRLHRPYQGLPATVPTTLSSDTSGEITSYTYEADAFGRLTRPKTIETKVNGNTTAKTTVDYTTSSSFASRDTLKIVTATRKDYSASGVGQTTSTRYFREDTGLYLVPATGEAIRPYEGFLRFQIQSVTNPDHSQVSYAYQFGSWDWNAAASSYSFTKSTSNGLDNGTATRTVAITGTSISTAGALYQAYDGYDIDDIYLVTGKSTMAVTIRDQYARVARTELHVWSGTAWQRVAWTNYDLYDYANQLVHTTSSTGAEYDAAYVGELKQWEKGASGVKVSFTYDDAGRVATAKQEAAGNIGAVTTHFSYDAEHRLTQEVVGDAVVGGAPAETITRSRTFDNAGRLVTEVSPGPNGGMTTTYAYDPAARQVTVTLPNGGTRVEAYQNDGRLAQRTGTAAIAAYHTYSVDASGVRYARVRLGTNASSRLRETWTDWRGRVTKASRPGFGSQPAYVDQADFDPTTGLLTKTKCYDGNLNSLYADTYYAYDDMGGRFRQGQDLDQSGTLTLLSSDRVGDADSYFELESASGQWWLTSVSKAYPKPNDDTSRVVSTVRQRLTGFTSANNIRAESVAIDVDGNATTRTTSVNRSAATTTIVTASAGVTGTRAETYVNGLLTSVTGFDGLTDTVGYDALHRLSTRTAPRTGTETTTYKTGSSYVATQLDAVPNIVASYTYDGAGRVIAVADAAGKFTRLAYNKRNQVIRRWGEATYPVELAYNALGEQVAQRTFGTSSADFTQAAWPLTDDVFDANGNPDPSTWTSGDKTTWTFDPASGLLAAKTDAAGKAVTYTYNARGQIKTRKWARPVPSSSPSTPVTTTYGYDDLTGDLLQQTYNDGTPNVGYTYTRVGQLDTVTDVAGTRNFIYNSSQPLRLDAVDVGSYYNGRVLTRQYDSNYRSAGFKLGTTSALDGDLNQLQTYDGATGRFDHLSTVSSALGSNVATYTYNNGGLVSGLTVGTSFSVARTYEDHRNLLASIDTKWGTTSRTRYEYAYNALGQRETATQKGDVFGDLGTTTTRFAYNGRGELEDAATYLGTDTSITDNQLSGRHHVFTYDNSGNRKSAGRTGNAAPGTPPSSDQFWANGLNQITSRENKYVHTAGTVADSTISVVVSDAGGPMPIGRQGNYWDAQLALDNVAHSANPAHPATGSVTVWATKPATGGASAVVKTETRPMAIAASPQQFHYDEDGNLVDDGIWIYTYDAENRLIKMTPADAATLAGFPSRVIEFRYDYAGRRVQKRVDSTYRRYLYDGDNLVAEFEATSTTCGNVLKSYTWGLDLAGSLGATGGVGALLQITDHTTGIGYFPTYDGNGNVVALIQGNTVGASLAGTVVAKYEYSTFGELLRCEGAYAKNNPFRFSTKFTDDESGLVYYGARYYSPALGRFINRDPLEEAGGLNLYGFCGNDGVNKWDVLGMDGAPPPAGDEDENPGPVYSGIAYPNHLGDMYVARGFFNAMQSRTVKNGPAKNDDANVTHATPQSTADVALGSGDGPNSELRAATDPRYMADGIGFSTYDQVYNYYRHKYRGVEMGIVLDDPNDIPAVQLWKNLPYAVEDFRAEIAARWAVGNALDRAGLILELGMIFSRGGKAEGAPRVGPASEPVRVTTPNAQMRENANVRGTYVDPLTGQVVPANGRLAADHIVPKDWIKQQPGFDKLTPEQQSWLLNHPLNTQGLPGTFNSSKGAKMPGEWTTYKGDPLDPAYINNDAARGEFLRAWITRQIEIFNAGK